MTEIIWRLLKLKRQLLPTVKIEDISLLKKIPTQINHFLKKFPINIHYGVKMYLDQLDTLDLAFNRIYEPEITFFIKNNLKPGSNAVDIGAHIGYYTLLFSKIVGNNGNVFAYEPSLSNYSILQKNILLNKLANIHAFNLAVSDYSGETELFESKSNTGDNRIYQPSGGFSKKIMIKCVRLDDMPQMFEKPISLIKMDIQGAEFSALKGMRKLIQINQNILLITEFWPYGMKMAGDKPEHFFYLLKELGFEIFDMSPFEFNKINEYMELSSKYSISDASAYTNLICSKNINPQFTLK